METKIVPVGERIDVRGMRRKYIRLERREKP